jgi:hypothetical protein
MPDAVRIRSDISDEEVEFILEELSRLEIRPCKHTTE